MRSNVYVYLRPSNTIRPRAKVADGGSARQGLRVRDVSTGRYREDEQVQTTSNSFRRGVEEHCFGIVPATDVKPAYLRDVAAHFAVDRVAAVSGRLSFRWMYTAEENGEFDRAILGETEGTKSWRTRAFARDCPGSIAKLFTRLQLFIVKS